MKRVIAITMLILLTLALCGCNEAEAGNRRLWILDGGARYVIYEERKGRGASKS